MTKTRSFATRHTSAAVAAAIAAGLPMLHATAQQPAGPLEEVLIVGKRLNRTSKGATNLPMSLADTPQAVSVVDREFIDRFGFDDVNEVLKLTTGVNVEEVETDRSYYTSRGFDIKSMQVDGIGLPFLWNVVGALDTAIYEKIEVIRGANGLLTGTGNPSGTINYVRKRPTNELAVATELWFESWNKRRVEADVSGPLTDSGTWAGRVVAAGQSAESWLDHYENDRTTFYGVIDGQVGRNTTVAFGFTRQDNESTGVLWGALPLLYADGTQTDFEVSATTTMRWTGWETHSETAFAEITHALSPGWELKAVLTRNEYDEPSELFYVYGAPGLDRGTGLGLYGWPGKHLAFSEQLLLDTTLTGGFDLGGRRHDLLIGFNAADADHGYLQHHAPADDPAWGALPPFPGWTGNEIARPAFGEAQLAADWTDENRRLYGVARFDAADALDLIVGFNAIDVESAGFNFDELRNRSEEQVSPYLGFTYGFTDALRVYASYSDIYEPQAELDENLELLGPAVGTSYEVGLKGEFFDRQLLASLSLFRAEQDNYAEYAGFDVDSGLSYYAGVDVESQGYELEVSGRIGERWHLIGGYTQLDLEDSAGAEARTFVPRETFNFGARFEPARLPGLELGGTARWLGGMHLDSPLGRIRQPSYAVLSAYMRYALSDRLDVAVNLDNLTDEKYLTSLYWDQAFYAAPRSGAVSVRLRY
ncbi:MAG: TonB-dependent siderophore receptor [Gammaproteobacteria bacterium]|nr:TonB-dependent siderophore receptor [Gammaproteobacteria bacterium]